MKRNKVNFLHSPEWIKLRTIALQRDLGKCVLCGSDQHVCVHHILYRRHYKDLKLDLDNLVCVCTKCHFNIHKSIGNMLLMAFLMKYRPQQFKYVIDNVPGLRQIYTG